MSGKREPTVAVAQSRKTHQAAAQFRKESRLWERTFNSVPDLIAILDCHHRIVRVNQPMAEKLGRTPEQCVGLKCYECVHRVKRAAVVLPSYAQSGRWQRARRRSA